MSKGSDGGRVKAGRSEDGMQGVCTYSHQG